MQFNSWPYIVLLVALPPAYYLLEARKQNWLLLLTSYWFYSLWDWRFCSLLFLWTVAVYFGGSKIGSSQDPRTRRRWLIACVVLGVVILGVFKYFNFFLENLYIVAEAIGLRVDRALYNVIAPIGVSFYVFQGLSYPIDIYRNDSRPSTSFLRVAVFVALFPQLAAGPIERARRILPQLGDKRCFNRENVESAIWLVFLGLFKKVVVADNLAFMTDGSFDRSATITIPVAYISLVAYAFQIYFDFSGYTDVARGSARLFGITLGENFDYPYLARDPRDFWRRWHISLSTWLRDYIYIPLGGNRGGRLTTYRNLLVTMGVCGLWHGASWNFILWGLYHGGLLVGYLLIADWRIVQLTRWLAIGVMFQFTLVGWLLFRCSRNGLVNGVPTDQSLAQITEFVGAIGRGWSFDAEFWDLVANTAFFVTPMIIVEAFMLVYGTKIVIQRAPRYVGVSITAVLLFMMIVYGVQQGDRFIYFRF